MAQQELTELAARFRRIAGTDATDESIRAAAADGGRLILALVKQGRYALSNDAKQAYRTVAPHKAMEARLREHQLSWLWQLAAADVLPDDMIHPNDCPNGRISAERSAIAAELLAERVAPTKQATVTDSDGATAAGDKTATAAEVIALVSPDGARALLIAKDTEPTAEERMRLLVALDQRFAGFDSEQWATLLGVTPAAIRKTDYWKKELRADR
jgi:hypothetical protein